MARPDDEDKPFVVRWNSLMRILIVDSSVKGVGRTAMDYADIYDGSSCRPSVARIAREAGYTPRTVQTAWAFLRGMKLAEVVREAVPARGYAAEYQLQIPDSWANLPILGPRSRDFTCLHCDEEFTPQPKVTLNEEDDDPPDTVRWRVWSLCFCPPPRKKNGRPGPWCFDEWNKQRVKDGKPEWSKVPNVWDLFREARGDEW